MRISFYMNIDLEECDRQMILLAIAELALSRPGWNNTLERLAAELNGREMFESFKQLTEMKKGKGQPDD